MDSLGSVGGRQRRRRRRGAGTDVGAAQDAGADRPQRRGAAPPAPLLPLQSQRRVRRRGLAARHRHGRTSFRCFLPGFTGFYWVLLGFTGFYRFLFSVSGFMDFIGFFVGFMEVYLNEVSWILLGLTWFHRGLQNFTGLNMVLEGFTVFYRVYTEFYWVLLGFITFY